MNPFPERWELVSFFEAEPAYDPSLDWFYNTLTFVTKRGEDEMECVIEPGEYILRLRWSHLEHEILCLDLRWVDGIRIESNNDRELLIATFDNDLLLPLRLEVKPSFHIFWRHSVSVIAQIDAENLSL